MKTNQHSPKQLKEKIKKKHQKKSWNKCENYNTKHQNLWNATKPLLTGKFGELKAYIKTKKRSFFFSSEQPNTISQGTRGRKINKFQS